MHQRRRSTICPVLATSHSRASVGRTARQCGLAVGAERHGADRSSVRQHLRLNAAARASRPRAWANWSWLSDIVLASRQHGLAVGAERHGNDGSLVLQRDVQRARLCPVFTSCQSRAGSCPTLPVRAVWPSLGLNATALTGPSCFSADVPNGLALSRPTAARCCPSCPSARSGRRG